LGTATDVECHVTVERAAVDVEGRDRHGCWIPVLARKLKDHHLVVAGVVGRMMRIGGGFTVAGNAQAGIIHLKNGFF
jgi:ribosomal protein L13E